MLEIYKDEFYKIIQDSKYRYVPGFYVIEETNGCFDESEKSINRLAELEKLIRDFLLENGVLLVGVYREQNGNKFRIYMIPYHVEVLNHLGISPDLYQPYIPEYLEYYDGSYEKEVNRYNELLLKKLKK